MGERITVRSGMMLPCHQPLTICAFVNINTTWHVVHFGVFGRLQSAGSYHWCMYIIRESFTVHWVCFWNLMTVTYCSCNCGHCWRFSCLYPSKCTVIVCLKYSTLRIPDFGHAVSRSLSIKVFSLGLNDRPFLQWGQRLNKSLKCHCLRMFCFSHIVEKVKFEWHNIYFGVFGD
jgi:hypothetical protein